MSSQNNNYTPKVLKIFDIRKQEVNDKKTGNKVDKAKVVFNEGIEIFYKGQKLDLGQYRGGFLKNKQEVLDGLDYAVENFGLKESRAEEQKSYVEDKRVSSIFEVNTTKKD